MVGTEDPDHEPHGSSTGGTRTDEHSNGSTTFGYADQTIATASTTVYDNTEDAPKPSYDKTLNPPPPSQRQ